MTLANAYSLDDLDIEYLWRRAIRGFWPFVKGGWGDTSRCWTWTGYTMTSGYGELGFKRVKMGAHRFSYLLVKGDLEAGQVIRHLCNNRSCVNPFHLVQGSYKQNWEDIGRGDAEVDHFLDMTGVLSPVEEREWADFWGLVL